MKNITVHHVVDTKRLCCIVASPPDRFSYFLLYTFQIKTYPIIYFLKTHFLKQRSFLKDHKTWNGGHQTYRAE